MTSPSFVFVDPSAIPLGASTGLSLVATFGAKGNGVADDAPAFAAMASTTNLVAVPPGTYRISTNVTVPATVSLWISPGAVISVDTGVTWTHLGPIFAPAHQVLFSGAGLVQLPNEHQVSAIWFGADPTGVAHSDTAVANALLALNVPPVSSTSAFNAWQGQELIFPSGTYSFQNTIELIRPCTLRGYGAFYPAYGATLAFGNTTFRFAQGICGIRTPWVLKYQNTQQPNDGHRGDYSRIKGIFIGGPGGVVLTTGSGSFDPIVQYSRWAPSMTPTLNKVYIPAHHVPFGHAYEATAVSGPTGTTEPDWRKVPWPPKLASAYANSPLTSQQTVAGDLYPASYLVSKQVWLQPSTPDGHVYALTTAGDNTGHAEPTFNSAPGATTSWGTQVWTEMGLRDTITDGGVTWTLRRCHGIDAQAVTIVEECNVAGFAGDGFHCDDVFNGGGNGQQVLRNWFFYCGGSGIFVTGGNSNAGYFFGNNINLCQNWGIYDASALGNYYYGNQQAGCKEGGTAVYGASMFGNYNEGGSGSLIVMNSSGIWIGGNQGGNAGDELSGSVNHPAWAASTAHSVGDFVSDAASLWFFQCISVSGDAKTGASSPFASGLVNGSPFSRTQNIVDNHVTWQPWGRTIASAGFYALQAGGATGVQPFDVVNSKGSQVITTHLSSRDTNLRSHGFEAADDSATWFGWNYVPASGRWQFTRALTNPALMAVTNTLAPEGANVCIFPQGFQLGPVLSEGLSTNSQTQLQSNPYRPFGRAKTTWTIGDEVRSSLQSDNNVADPSGPGCTIGWKACQSGRAATSWVNGETVAHYQTANGGTNFLIAPSPSQWNGHYYKCTTVTGTTVGPVEPGTGALVGTPWPTGSGATVTDGNGNVFTEQGLASDFIEMGSARIEDQLVVDLSEGAPQVNTGSAPIKVTLTAHQCCARRIKLISSSTLTDDVKVIIQTAHQLFPGAAHNSSFGAGVQVAAAPNSSQWIVQDATTPGTHSVTIAASASDAGVLSINGQTANYLSDGTSMVRASGFSPTSMSAASVTVTGGAVTLSAQQYATPLLRLTGTLTGNATVVFPNQSGVWFVSISGLTLGGFTLTFQSGTATTSAISSLSATSQIYMVAAYGSNTIDLNT